MCSVGEEIVMKINGNRAETSLPQARPVENTKVQNQLNGEKKMTLSTLGSERKSQHKP